MPIRFQGPSNAEIEKQIDSLQNVAEGRVSEAIGNITTGAAAIIKLAYQKKIYQTPIGAFGYPKDQNQTLAQAVQTETDGLNGEVFTNKPEASYVEFGTGIYNTKGAKKPIRPKRAGGFLAFPVWQLPPRFKGYFIDREDTSFQILGKDLPFGAIGVVLAKEVDGMRARPVWGEPEVLKAISRLVEVEVKEARL